jgi:hypothetical protein
MRKEFVYNQFCHFGYSPKKSQEFTNYLFSKNTALPKNDQLEYTHLILIDQMYYFSKGTTQQIDFALDRIYEYNKDYAKSLPSAVDALISKNLSHSSLPSDLEELIKLRESVDDYCITESSNLVKEAYKILNTHN